MPRKPDVITHTVHEVSEICGIQEGRLVTFIRREWITPAVPEPERWALDEEDIARARLILELQERLGVNDEAVPLILHLLDQIHALVAGLDELSERRKQQKAS